jgi:hypothetical protein
VIFAKFSPNFPEKAAVNPKIFKKNIYIFPLYYTIKIKNFQLLIFLKIYDIIYIESKGRTPQNFSEKSKEKI